VDEFTGLIPGHTITDAESDLDAVVLAYAKREKTRQKAHLDSGEAVGIRLPRGSVMRGGDRLQSDTGRQVIVRAAAEKVSTIYSDDPELLARVAYHLGNRHVWVQVGDRWLRYLADHVLDDMVRGFGCDPCAEDAPFEPEGGAYDSQHNASHNHSHSHTHNRTHSHE
jgi:urease accessory protein